MCSLSLVCREVRSESTSFFFGVNHFSFVCLGAIPVGLSRFPTSTIKFLKKIDLKIDDYEPKSTNSILVEATKALSSLSVLDEVTFRIEDGRWIDRRVRKDSAYALKSYYDVPALLDFVRLAASAKEVRVARPRWCQDVSSSEKFERFMKEAAQNMGVHLQVENNEQNGVE